MSRTESFRRDPAGNQSCLAKTGHQPEASLAGCSDSRLQKDKGMVKPGYNAQNVKLIVAADVCNQQTDQRLLGAMVGQTIELKKELGIVEQSGIVADAGYFNETDILAYQQGQTARVTVQSRRKVNAKVRRRKSSGWRSFTTIPSKTHGNACWECCCEGSPPSRRPTKTDG